MKTGRFVAGIATLALSLPAAANAAEDWLQVFEKACSRSQEAMAMSREELQELISRCDRIRSALQEEDATVRKVFLKRVEMCRNLYQFALEAKGNPTPSPEP